MRRMLWLLLMPGCLWATDEDDTIEHREGLFCGTNTLDLLPPELHATNPFITNSRPIDAQPACWNATTDANERTGEATMVLTLIGDEGPPLLGCAFSGTGISMYSEGSITFTEGSCVLPSATGYYRLALTAPAVLELSYANQVDFPVSWQEVRGDDLIVGTGALYWRRPMNGGPDQSAYDPRVPVDPNASCRMPACSTVSFAGKGVLMAGNPLVCDGLLASYADPFAIYFDAHNAMSFAADGSSPMPSVLDKTTCGASTWLGERPHPFRRYHLDATTNVFTLDETVLHTAVMLTDLCTVRWQTTVTGC